MGTAWSRWLEADGAFDKTRYVDAKAQRTFYASLKLAVAAIERAIEEESAPALDADATDATADEDAITQLQYVLENWAREAGALFDRVGDFPLILPIPTELRAGEPLATSTEPLDGELPSSREELMLKATSNDKMATTAKLHEAIQRLVNKLPEGGYLRLVAKYPRATRLFVSQQILAKTDVETPFRLLITSRQHTKAALLVGKLAYGEESFAKKMERLQEMTALLQRAQDAPTATASDRSAASFHRVMTEEMIELIDMQDQLENQLGVMHLIGGSVVETIHKLLTLFPTVPTALSSAVALGEDFNVHPKQFWWCLLRILVANDQWRTLLMLSGTVPPPFGFVPIAEAIVDAQRPELASDLLVCITTGNERDAVLMYLATHFPAQAALSDGDESSQVVEV